MGDVEAYIERRRPSGDPKEESYRKFSMFLLFKPDQLNIIFRLYHKAYSLEQSFAF